MINEKIDPEKFCTKFFFPEDFSKIYLGNKNTLTHCTCPPPPKFPEPEPIDEEYIYDSRYISEKDLKEYYAEYEEMIREKREIEMEKYYESNFFINNYDYEIEEEEELYVSNDDDEEEMEYSEDDFEVVGEK